MFSFCWHAVCALLIYIWIFLEWMQIFIINMPPYPTALFRCFCSFLAFPIVKINLAFFSSGVWCQVFPVFALIIWKMIKKMHRWVEAYIVYIFMSIKPSRLVYSLSSKGIKAVSACHCNHCTRYTKRQVTMAIILELHATLHGNVLAWTDSIWILDLKKSKQLLIFLCEVIKEIQLHTHTVSDQVRCDHISPLFHEIKVDYRGRKPSPLLFLVYWSLAYSDPDWPDWMVHWSRSCSSPTRPLFDSMGLLLYGSGPWL